MKKLLFIFLLVPFLGVAQNNIAIKGMMSLNTTDTAAIQNYRNSLQTSYGNTGGFYYDKTRNKWRIWEGICPDTAFHSGCWVDLLNTGGGATNPAGSNNQIQFNKNGAFGASPNFTYDTATTFTRLRLVSPNGIASGGAMQAFSSNTNNAATIFLGDLNVGSSLVLSGGNSPVSNGVSTTNADLSLGAASNHDVTISTNGTGKIVMSTLKGISFNGSQGTSGQVLTSAGTSAPPSWANPSGIQLANNGLSISGDTVQLGGNFTKTTIIGNLAKAGFIYDTLGGFYDHKTTGLFSGNINGFDKNYASAYTSEDASLTNTSSGIESNFGNNKYYSRVITVASGSTSTIGMNVIGGNLQLYTSKVNGVSSALRLNIDSVGNISLPNSNTYASHFGSVGITNDLNVDSLSFFTGSNSPTKLTELKIDIANPTEMARFQLQGGNFTIKTSQSNVSPIERFKIDSTGIVTMFGNSATLDFPSTAAGTSSDLTVSYPGALDGDAVFIGCPNNVCGSDPTIFFTAWVSGTDTVTIRYNHQGSGAAFDPPSGNFNVKVIK